MRSSDSTRSARESKRERRCLARASSSSSLLGWPPRRISRAATAANLPKNSGIRSQQQQLVGVAPQADLQGCHSREPATKFRVQVPAAAACWGGPPGGSPGLPQPQTCQAAACLLWVLSLVQLTMSLSACWGGPPGGSPELPQPQTCHKFQVLGFRLQQQQLVRVAPQAGSPGLLQPQTCQAAAGWVADVLIMS